MCPTVKRSLGNHFYLYPDEFVIFARLQVKRFILPVPSKVSKIIFNRLISFGHWVGLEINNLVWITGPHKRH